MTFRNRTAANQGKLVTLRMTTWDRTAGRATLELTENVKDGWSRFVCIVGLELTDVPADAKENHL
eukprot:scaffold981_cov119-Cylindrotheca_fusiformis.AAC.1